MNTSTKDILERKIIDLGYSARNSELILYEQSHSPIQLDSLNQDQNIKTLYVPKRDFDHHLPRNDSFFLRMDKKTNEVALFKSVRKIYSGIESDAFLFESVNSQEQWVVKKSKSFYTMDLYINHRVNTKINCLYVRACCDDSLDYVLYYSENSCFKGNISSYFLDKFNIEFDVPLTIKSIKEDLLPHLESLLEWIYEQQHANPYWSLYVNIYDMVISRRNRARDCEIENLVYGDHKSLLFFYNSSNYGLTRYTSRQLVPYINGETLHELHENIHDEQIQIHLILLIMKSVLNLHKKHIVHGNLLMKNIMVLIEDANKSNCKCEEYSVSTIFSTIEGKRIFLKVTCIDFELSNIVNKKVITYDRDSYNNMEKLHIAPENMDLNHDLLAHPSQDVYSLGYLFDILIDKFPGDKNLHKTYPVLDEFIQQAVDIDPKKRPNLLTAYNKLEESIACKTYCGAFYYKFQQVKMSFFNIAATERYVDNNSSDLLNRRYGNRVFHPGLI